MQTERRKMAASAAALQEQLRHAYWIGGGSSAGKSTVARRIAAERGLQLYATGNAMADHSKQCTLECCPLLHEFIAMDMDERWVYRSPKEMLETFHWFRGEGFHLIIEDTLRLPKESGVVADGFRLLSHLVKPLLAVRRHAVWLLPTHKFRQAVFDSRGGAQSGFIGKTSDPKQAFRNLLERDSVFTHRLYEEAKHLGLNTIKVTTMMTVDNLAGRVTEAFGL